MGGYLAGRLRTKWLAVHTDEVYFRDTAHGFLGLGSRDGRHGGVAGVGRHLRRRRRPAGRRSGRRRSVHDDCRNGRRRRRLAADAELSESERRATRCPISSIRCFGRRRVNGARRRAEGSDAALAEVTRIFANALRTDSLPRDDVRYVGQVIAERTDLTQQQAEQRVTETFARLQTTLDEAETAAREAADTAREAAARTALWLFISLLIGAFIASWMATFGGRQRDL